MGRIATRIVSWILAAAGWTLLVVRGVLDLVGYATVPEDAGVAVGRLDQVLGWLLGLPWFAVVLLFALALIPLIVVAWRTGAASSSRTTVPTKIKTSIQLQFGAAKAAPVALQSKNIWRWYSFGGGLVVQQPDGSTVEATLTTLVLTFDRPTSFKQLVVEEDTPTGLLNEVKDSSPRHAIISWNGAPANCRIAVRTIN